MVAAHGGDHLGITRGQMRALVTMGPVLCDILRKLVAAADGEGSG